MAGEGHVLRLDPRLSRISRHRPESCRLGRTGGKRPLPAYGRLDGGLHRRLGTVTAHDGEAMRPQLLLVSAGFDYVAGDCVGDLGVGIEAAAASAQR